MRARGGFRDSLSVYVNRSNCRAVCIATLVLSLVIVACSLQDGGVEELQSNGADAASGSDATTDASSGADSAIADAAPDHAVPGPDSGRDSGSPRLIYASTNEGIYALNVTSPPIVLHEIAKFATCGVNAGNNNDLAVDSNGVVHVYVSNTSGNYQFYGFDEADGGCPLVHAGHVPFSNTLWEAFQKVGAGDILVNVAAGSNSIGFSAADTTNGNVIGSLPGNASADLACSSAICYTALTSNNCPSDAGNTDCLVTFEYDGGSEAQIGNFGKAGVIGLAYDSGYVYGFFADGSVVQLSVTPGSTGQPFLYTKSGSSVLVWQGAGSSSANE